MLRIVPSCLAALALLVLVAAQAAMPANAQTMPGYRPVELDYDTANSALDALSSVHEVAQRYEARVPPGGDGPLSGVTNMALYQLARAELDAAVGAHGFSSYEDWTAHIGSLFHAYAFVQSAGAMAAAAPALQRALQQMKDDPNVPEATKRALAAQAGALSSAGGPAGAGAPSPNNQQVAQRLSDRIMEATQAMRSRP